MWAKHAITLDAWGLVCGQWRFVPMGGVLRLDSGAVKVLLDAAAIALDRERLEGLRVMGRAACEVFWADRRARS